MIGIGERNEPWFECGCFCRSQEEVPPNVYYAHYKNVEKSVINGKFDPTAGLSSSGIAGTGTDKEDDDAAANKSANADEEMKDISKKDGGKNNLIPKLHFAPKTVPSGTQWTRQTFSFYYFFFNFIFDSFLFMISVAKNKRQRQRQRRRKTCVRRK